MTKTNTNRTIGYARVSTRQQHLEAQTDALDAYKPHKVFTDKVTGRTMDRPGWEACRDYLRPGDTLVVVGLDRLGRSALEVIDTVNGLATDGVIVHSLREGVLDPSTATGSLMLTMLAALGQFEVELKAERAAAAREAAAARGLQTGRPRAHADDVATKAVAMRREGATVPEVCKTYGIPRATFYRYWKAAQADSDAS